jgi:hypothetical protein
MAKCTLDLFCSSEELVGIVGTLITKWTLSCLVFQNLDSDGLLVTEPKEVLTPFHTAFLFPRGEESKSLKWSDQRPRDWGWITITAGLLVRDANGPAQLRLSVIAAEDPASESVRPVKYVQWLKRSLQAAEKARWGVEGENTVTGGRSSYRDIGYTKAALRLFHEGVEWKDRYSTRVIFRPEG